MRITVTCIILLALASTGLAQYGPEIQIIEYIYDQNDITLADMDGDGDLDLLYDGMWNNDNTRDFVEWLEQDEAQTIRHPIDHGFLSRDFQAADMDGDGDLDVVMGASEFVAWYENTGSDDWVQHMVDETIDAILVRPADLDLDGDLDIVTTGMDQFCWHENTGVGWIYHPLNDLRASNLDVADMDGDGDIDLLTSMPYPLHVDWWENDGAVFTIHDIWEEIPADVDPVDIDGDGDMDVLATGQSVAIYQNTDWQWTRNPVYQFTPGRSAYVSVAGDLEGDGDIDIITLFGDPDRGVPDIFQFRQEGGNWTEGFVTYDFYDPYNVELVDLNDDGLLDIVTVSKQLNEIAWFQQHDQWWEKKRIQGNGLPGEEISQQPIDWDADGDTDFFELRVQPNQVVIYENRQSSWSTHSILQTAMKPNYATPCDLDADGDFDILAIGNQKRTFAWYEDVGGEYAYHLIDYAPHEPLYHGFSLVIPGNLDDDPELEVLAYRDQFLIGYDRNGNTWERHLLAVFTSGWYHSSAAGGDLMDMDGDGDLDLVTTLDGLRCYENEGANWIEHIIYDSNSGPEHIKTGDVDLDGYPDILYQSAGNIEFYHNEGGYTFSMTELVDSGLGFDLADVDGDLDLDLATSYRVADDVYTASLFLWDGTTFTETIIDSVAYYETWFGDYDADGDPDLFLRPWNGYAWRENLYNAAPGTFTSATAINPDQTALPTIFSVSTPYPNPFNATATVTLQLPQTGMVRVSLINVLGREVGVLVDGVLPAGTHPLSINARNLASGVYFVRAEAAAGQSSQTITVVLK